MWEITQSNCHKFYVVMVKHVLVNRKTRGKTRSKFKMTQSYMRMNGWKLKQNNPL